MCKSLISMKLTSDVVPGKIAHACTFFNVLAFEWEKTASKIGNTFHGISREILGLKSCSNVCRLTKNWQCSPTTSN